MKKLFMLMRYEQFNHQHGVREKALGYLIINIISLDLDKDSQQAKDIERFRWFSQDYLGYDEEKSL